MKAPVHIDMIRAPRWWARASAEDAPGKSASQSAQPGTTIVSASSRAFSPRLAKTVMPVQGEVCTLPRSKAGELKLVAVAREVAEYLRRGSQVNDVHRGERQE